MNKRLKGKNIIITGASGGIGEQMALKIAENGGNLALIARRGHLLEELKQKVENSYQSKVNIYPLDIAKYDEIPGVFQTILNDFGDIHGLINNAGFGVFKEAHEAPFSEVKGMFEVNVLGLMAATGAILPHMRERGSGHIVNIASQAGKFATPKSSAYSASKHAVLGYTNSLRMEAERYGVNVTAVNPGPIATDFFSIADESGTYVKNVEKWMLDPRFVAEKVVDSMFTRKREINLPVWMNAGSVVYQLFPSFVEKVGNKLFFKK
ncbi:SDR family oxidoreductase [Rossellomorea aquimaris]|uniref:SDR family NAD(P)-dependent oxidoreductase n=1 Tax=Rossellomorea aquimaris TaxID=189382 RepID=UPI001CD800C4|nr:SDR family oxidoreductase [Rossellomorea aquimaris]MCA1054734.1 SDR family oxidoreductase [Rossellomorea aquimaris]